MTSTHWRSAIRRALHFVGPRGAVLMAACVALALLLAAVEYALAIALLVFLYALHLVAPAQLPVWVRALVHDAPPAALWGGLLVLGLARAAAMVGDYVARGLLAEGTHARMQMALAYKVLMARDVRAMPLSEMSLLTGEVFPKAADYLLYFAHTVASLLQAVLMGVGMFVLAPWAAVAGLAGLGALGGLALGLNRITSRFGARVPEARADLERTKVRVTRNRLLIRIFGVEETEYAAWLRSAHAYFRNNTFSYVVGHVGGALMPALGLGLIAGIVLAGARFTGTPAASLVAFFYLFYRLQQLVSQASTLMGALASYRPQAMRAMDLVLSLSPEERRAAMRPERQFRLTRRALDAASWRPAGAAARRANGKTPAPVVALRDVSYRWPDTGAAVLRDLTIEAAPGTQLAIVGPNGSGKSTLLGLMLGALRPSSGEVRVGGEPGDAWVRAHAGAIAYVGPEPFLVHGSVRENLVYGAGRTCAEAEIWEALETVGLGAFFRDLPGSLEYGILENGDGLSSGQKQRLALARSFLRRPALFVMDEPSANLDAESEALILDALARLKRRCTVVVVSHRPGMLRDADQVLQLGARGGTGSA